MGTVSVSERARNASSWRRPTGIRSLLVNLTPSAIHATIPGGGAVDVTTAFTAPTAGDADRIPQLALAGGGTPATYTLTGTFDGAVQTDTILTVAAATVKATKAFDLITRIQGLDPVQNLDLQWGDTLLAPATHLHVGGAGNINMQLEEDSALSVWSAVPVGRLEFLVLRINPTSTTATALRAVY